MKLENYFRGKKGSTSILLTAIFLSMVLVIGVLAEAASGKAVRSYAQGVSDLAARSILTEYQRELKREYGLFAFHGDKETIENKMNMYMKASFQKSEEKTSMDVLRWKTEGIDADISGYSLTDVNILEDEIYQYMKYYLTEKALDEVLVGETDALAHIESGKNIAKMKKTESERLKQTLEEEEKENDDSEGGKEETETVKEGKKKLKQIKEFGEAAVKRESEHSGSSNIVLRNNAVIETLPSKILDKPHSFQLGGLKTAAVNEYILDTFYNQVHHGDQRDRFFENEVEYILWGGMNDQSNYKKVKVELIAMRTALNIAYLYADSVKRNEALTLATSLTPGPWAPITQFIIITAWAASEAANDMKLLEEGKKVPILKDDASWYLSLEGIAAGKAEGTSNEIGSNGLNYEGYLRILLAMKNREEKLIRVMDLIQINLKGNSDDAFLLQDYCIGFSYRSQISKISGFFKVMGSARRPSEVLGTCTYRKDSGMNN